MLGFLISVFLGGFILGCLITASVIRDALREKNEKKSRQGKIFCAKIRSIQKNTVKVDEIDRYGCLLESAKLESEDGVSDELYVGQKIYV